MSKDKTELKWCKRCQLVFKCSVKKPNQVYCSKKCRDEQQIIRNSANRFVIFDRDMHQCIYCGLSSIEDRTELHVDHVVPLDKGGKDIASNLVTACSQCNVAKSTKRSSSEERILREVARRNLEYGVLPNMPVRAS